MARALAVKVARRAPEQLDLLGESTVARDAMAAKKPRHVALEARPAETPARARTKAAVSSREVNTAGSDLRCLQDHPLTRRGGRLFCKECDP